MGNRRFIGITHSACSKCRTLVPSRISCTDDAVYSLKFCKEHGQEEVVIYGDPADYLSRRRFVKPAVTPERFFGNSELPCPDGCGFCSRHEQHLCMPIFEITEHCNLACPICLNSSGGGKDCSPDEFRTMLDKIFEAEKQIDVMNLSGGEPLLHPQLLELIDEALSRSGVVRVSISTNGLEFIDNPELVHELKKRDVVISLQFDGDDDNIYRVLRGRPLLAEKLKIIDILSDADISMSLTMTIMKGLNENAVKDGLDLLFSHDNIVSLMIQPAAFVGRGAGLKKDYSRISIPEIIDKLELHGKLRVGRRHFIPLPCSHPQCFSLAYYLKLNSGAFISITDFTDIAGSLDAMSNRVVFGLDPSEHSKLKEMIYDLWSGPAAMVPESEQVLKTLKNILQSFPSSQQGCNCFNPRKAFGMMERRVKSVFIHAFQDADTFDLERARRCCHAYPQSDGTLVPACVRNVMRLDGKDQS